MSIDLGRTERDYEARLVERCKKWEASNAAEAVVLRRETLVKIGMIAAPPADGIRRMVLEGAVREAIRKQHKWPTVEEWIREGL